MSELVANCPRCRAKEMTFDLVSALPTVIQYDWQRWYEAFCICRACRRSTIFVLSQSEYDASSILEKTSLPKLDFAVNRIMRVEGHISPKDEIAALPPEHLPPNIEAAFKEGGACLAIGCPNAAATMFRLCVDLATRPMLPEGGEVEGLNRSVRRNLGLRLRWLFGNGILPEGLRDLSTCIKDDGNDGAHEGSLTENDAADILDFTRVLLERIYTEPKRIELARDRRTARHKK
jgi:Domain of unknown function (DUF4145)